MNQYKDFQPTGFDAKGLSGDKVGISDFYIVLAHNRDSGVLDESNWRTGLKMLGGESATVQIHRFGHWACGWFELLLVDPTDGDKVAIAGKIEDSLENYPVLDDMDYSELEFEYACDMGWHIDDNTGEYLNDDGEVMYVE